MNARPILKVVDKNWASSQGRIIYDPVRPGLKSKTKRWVICTADREITRYFRWWVDKEILNPLGMPKRGLCQPSWDAHCSIVRGEADMKNSKVDDISKLWGKHNEALVTFEYSLNPQLSMDTATNEPKPYWFVNVRCEAMTELRKELGLIIYPNFHITIGRTY